MRKLTLVVVLIAIVSAIAVHAQMAHRLKGTFRSTTGATPAGVTIRADNLSGFRGEPFAGQKEHTATTNDKGEWSITGI